MRAFVALEVPRSTLDLLASFQKELGAAGADLKLVERENLHFTVKFLGEISEAQAREADSRLRGLRLGALNVELKGVGAFPAPARPRVIWAGVSREHESLFLPAATEVIRSLEGIGERDDRPFRPHLTLARVRSGRNVEELQGAIRRNADRSFGTARLESLKLKSSRLTPQGPVYTDLGEYRLS
jgi:2'-5' RNA ligase